MNTETNSLPERGSLHPVVRDVLISGVTSVSVSAASLLVVSLIGRLGGPKEVAEYLLLRRVSAWILSGVLLGITMALPRYVAHAVNRPARQKTYFSVAFVLAMGATSLVAGIACLRPGACARLLFGAPYFQSLVLPLALVLLANAFHATVFGFYRGRLQMERANALQFLNFAVFPLLSVLALRFRGSIASMFAVLALMILASSALMAVSVFREKSEPQTGWRSISGELLRYGIARIPGDLALGALFTIAPIIASHYISLPKLAPLLLGLGVLSVLGTGANPLNQVLLSKISMMLAEERMSEARRYIRHLLSASVEISCFVCVQAVIFADVAIRIWVGPKYLSDMLLIRMLLVAAPFYLVHTALRCVIDAASVTAYNTRNILIASGFFALAICAAIWMAPNSLLLRCITAIFVLAMIVVGWLTARTLNQLFQVKLSWRDSGPCLAFSAFLGLASFLFRLVEHFQTRALEAIGLELLLTALFVAFLSCRSAPWFAFLSEIFVRKIPAVQPTEATALLKSA